MGFAVGEVETPKPPLMYGTLDDTINSTLYFQHCNDNNYSDNTKQFLKELINNYCLYPVRF